MWGVSLLAAKEMDNQLVALPSVYCQSRPASSFSTRLAMTSM
jgi:hypothetical protein